MFLFQIRRQNSCHKNKGSANGQSGFTLIEIVVALVIFSLISIMGYEAMNGAIDYHNRSRVAYEWQNQLHKSNAIIMQDILHLRPRPIRDRLGGQERAYHTTDPDYVVQFTRGGLPSVQGSTLGGMQRVAYSVSDENELLRWTWKTLDAFVTEEPNSQVLMEEVKSLEFFHLNSRNEFEEDWPPLNETISIDSLPRLIRFELELINGDKIERTMPGVENLPRSVTPIIPRAPTDAPDSDTRADERNGDDDQ